MTHEPPIWDDVETEKVCYRLRLYVTGASGNSMRAIANIKTICETYLKDMYSLEVIDVNHDHDLVRREQIIALPLLVRLAPEPRRNLIGDMSDTQKVLRGLGLQR